MSDLQQTLREAADLIEDVRRPLEAHYKTLSSRLCQSDGIRRANLLMVRIARLDDLQRRLRKELNHHA